MENQVLNNVLQSNAVQQAILTCIREEVSRVGATSTTSTSPSTSVANEQRCFLGNSSSTAAVTTPSREGVRDELRRLFPTTSARRKSSTTSAKKSRSEDKRNQIYLVDAILVKHGCKKTLMGKKKAEAFDEGYAISSIELNKGMTSDEVNDVFQQCFASRLNDRDFQILVPVGGYLVEPRLSAYQSLDGLQVFKMFYRKPLYLRILQPASNVDDSLNLDIISNNSLCAGSDGIVLEEEEPISYAHDSIFDDFSLSNVSDNYWSKTEPKSLNEIIEKLREKIVNDTCSYFNVYRENIYESYLRGSTRKSFSPFNKFNVCFTDNYDTSEGAADMGGPTREFFRLLMDYVRNSRIFKGEDSNKYLVLNKDSLEKKEYFHAGQIIALSLIHCGLCPHFFSQFLFNLTVSATDFSPTINDIVESEIAEEIQNVMKCNNLNDLRTVIIEGIYFKLAGWENVVGFEKKDEIIQDVIKFYTVDRLKPALCQFIDGIKVTGLYVEMIKYPEYFVDALCPGKGSVLDVTVIEEWLTIEYSEEGSNRRRIENKIAAYFKDYLVDCQDDETFEDGCNCTLEEVLSFCTGMNAIPLFGFPSKITVRFLHDDDSPFPKANTCGLYLYLPVIHTDYAVFKSRMTFAVKNGMVFGHL